MESNTLSAADIAAVTNPRMGYGCYDGGFGGDSWAWIILVILLGGVGGFGYGNGGRCATVEDVNNSANFTRLENQVRMNENTIQQGFTNIGNGICDLGYKELQNFSTLRYDNAIGQKELSAQIADCCCKTQTAIHAEGEATRALIQENKIEALQQKINALELQSALCGVVRYPTALTYTTSCNPFCPQTTTPATTA
jgi:hypothetical protein